MEGRARAATPGEWRTCVSDETGGWGLCIGAGDRLLFRATGRGEHERKRANAAFITHARTDLPRLIARTRGLARERDAAEVRAEKAEAECAAWAAADSRAVAAVAAENDALRAALQVIERRLREDAAPLVALINAHGGAVERNAWKAVYSSAVHAQGVLKSAALGRTP